MVAELDALHARALDLLVAGDTAGGISDLRAYLDAEPGDADGWLELGAAYATVGEGHKIQAADALKRAVDLDGERLDARLSYADALVRLGKTDLAAFQLVQATRIAPGDARAMKALGLAFYDKRLFDKAATWLRKAALAAPDDARAHYALGLAEEARRDVGSSIAAYRAAVACDPSFADARMTLADSLASMGEHAQAIAEIDAVLALGSRGGVHGGVIERAAHNRDVLVQALEGMLKSRLLGKPARDVDASALVEHGGMKKRSTGTAAARYAAPLFELDVACDEAGKATSLTLVLPSPERAAKTPDELFRVTALGLDGKPRPADVGTAATLTFLREAIGCPMTQAGELYGRLLAGEPAVTWGGAKVAFTAEAERSGLRATLEVPPQ